MKEIWVIANCSSRTCGHGDSAMVTELLTKGAYGTGDHHPAFTSAASAQKYIEATGVWNGKPVKLDVQAG